MGTKTQIVGPDSMKGFGRYDMDEGRLLAPDDVIPHLCNGAGRCCVNSAVSLTPFDVWRFFATPAQPLLNFGVLTTIDLFRTKTNLVSLGVGSESSLPICRVQFSRARDDGPWVCPFLKPADGTDRVEPWKDVVDTNALGEEFWHDADGKARFDCALGPVRPVQCQIFPLGRIGKPSDEDKMFSWRFYCDTHECRKCGVEPVCAGGSGVKMTEYLSRTEVVVAMNATSLYVDFLARMAAMRLPLESIWRTARSMFDFDGMLVACGVKDPAQLLKMRPSRHEELIVAGHAVARRYYQELHGEEESLLIAPPKPEIIAPPTLTIVKP